MESKFYPVKVIDKKGFLKKEISEKSLRKKHWKDFEDNSKTARFIMGDGQQEDHGYQNQFANE